MFDLNGIKVQIENSFSAMNEWFSNVGSSNFGNNNYFEGPMVEFARAVLTVKGWSA